MAKNPLTDRQRAELAFEAEKSVWEYGRKLCERLLARSPNGDLGIIKELAREYPPQCSAAVQETLIQRARATLPSCPEDRDAVVEDATTEPGTVLVGIARRDGFACVLSMPAEEWNRTDLLELVEGHTAH